jgi:hypothetical protein
MILGAPAALTLASTTLTMLAIRILVARGGVSLSAIDFKPSFKVKDSGPECVTPENKYR